MFKHIFVFETRQWLRNPRFYIYTSILFLYAYLVTISVGGFFESVTATVSSLEKINSTQSLLGLINAIVLIGFLFLPSIAGSMITKDFETKFHNVLYSYPLSKWEYLFAKFTSAYLIAFFISLGVFLGVVAGFITPGLDANLIGPHHLKPYVQIYLVYVIPNLLFLSILVFAVSTFSRSIVAGFIVVIVLYVFQGIASNMMGNLDNKVLAALIDPFGENCNQYYVQYWSVFEKNENGLPLNILVILNRLIWIFVSIVIGTFVYRRFRFTQIDDTSKASKKVYSDTQPQKHGSLQTIKIPFVKTESGLMAAMRSIISMTKMDLKYIIKNSTFLIICIIAILFMAITHFSLEIFDTPTLPVTRNILQITGLTFQFFVCLLTFLFSGLLINRPLKVNIFQLEDSSPAINGSFLCSKFLTVTTIQIILLFIVIITGISLQIYHGYYRFEPLLYIKELFGIKLIGYMIWTLLSIFIHTMFSGFYTAFFILLVLFMTRVFWDNIGIEQDIYKYNDGPSTFYSDLNGYGNSWKSYWIYKLYWLMLGIAFYATALAAWRRGMQAGFKERLKLLSNNLHGIRSLSVIIPFIAFITLGGFIFYRTNVTQPYLSQKKQEQTRIDYEKKYKSFGNKPHPKISDVELKVDLFPSEKNILVSGSYVMINSNSLPVDTFLISLPIENGIYDLITDLKFNKAIHLVNSDSLLACFVYAFDSPLAAGDSFQLDFAIRNKENLLLNQNRLVRTNGTFINNAEFLPEIGYNPNAEHTDTKTRKKYGLEEKERMPSPEDSASLHTNYISINADWIDFEITISTSINQTAIAPGVLVKQWQESGRNYFQYKMPVKMLNFFNICSGIFEIRSDEWNGIKIKVYYDKAHPYNVERIINGVKKSLEYCTTNYSPYQHPEIRIVEVPYVGFAQSFAMTIPFSENIGFIADVDDSKSDQYDYPFLVSAHEIAHQWWAHQVIGAYAQGSTVMSESLSEYTSLKVLEKQYGAEKMRRFLKGNLDKYLGGRQTERKKEQALIYCENQQYIHYDKGSLVLYALSDYLGESVFNKALSDYLMQVRYRVPYTTSLEFLKAIEKVTPDSLRYYLDDNMSNITLYDNRIINANCTLQEDGLYRVDLEFQVSKYRSGETGKRIYANTQGDSLVNKQELIKNQIKSFPLADYIEVGVFAEDHENKNGTERMLYLQKHKFTEIENKLSILLKEKPDIAGIDPYNKLIDTDSDDNRRKVMCK